jgi:hypothetical protein
MAPYLLDASLIHPGGTGGPVKMTRHPENSHPRPCASRRRRAAVLLCLLSLACATTKPGDVVEYRYFPAYDTYLPIMYRSWGHEAEARWVLRAPGDGELLEPPATAAEAAQRVEARASFERRQNAREMARSTALFPVMVLLALPAMALFIVLDPYLHHRMHEEAVERRRALEAFAGVPIRIEVRNPSGNAVPGSRVWAAAYPEHFADHLDAEGRRAFGVARPFTRMPTRRWLELETRHLPIHLGHRKSYRGSGINVGRVARSWGDTAHVREEEPGTIRWLSMMYESDAEHVDEGWRWKEPPSPRSLVLHVWAPGHAPARRWVKDARPGREVAVTVKLVPRPDVARVQALCRNFDATVHALAEAMHPGRLTGWIDEEVFGMELPRLEGWVGDARLPVYLRWNALQVIESLAEFGGGLITGRAQTAEARAALARAHLDGEAESPWSLRKGLIDWTWQVREGLEPHSMTRFYGDTPRWVDPISEARKLLAQGKRIDPGYPLLDQLRAALALNAGERERAVSLSRYMDDRLFLRVFHDGLDLSL